MSNQDSFINEVTEEVRRDRLFAMMRRYGWIAVLLVILLVGGAAANEWRKASARAEAEASGDALIAALREDSADSRAAALNAIEPTDEPGKRAVLGLLQSAASGEAGDAAAAEAALDAIIGDTEVPQVYRDLATLKRGFAVVRKGDKVVTGVAKATGRLEIEFKDGRVAAEAQGKAPAPRPKGKAPDQGSLF